MPSIKFRPLADPKYQRALTIMNVRHSQDWDCGDSQCVKCEPYRKIEQAYWQSMTDEQKAEVRFFRYGI